jgi:hypothetical protein
MHCPVHGDVTSLGPIDPELEAALAATQGEVVSEPPADAKPLPCRAHGSPFAEMAIREDGTNWKVYEDGCREPL